MNERWTRGVRQALLFLLVAVLGACSVGRLSDRIVIDAGTQVTGETGKVITIGEDGFLVTGSLLDGQGITLRPGDVLTYTRWSPGVADPKMQPRQTHEPSSDRHLIALRHISEDVIDAGRLTPEEARFLSTILTTQRTNWKNAFEGESFVEEVTAVSKILEQNQVHLWNALVKSIVLLRLDRKIPGLTNPSRVLIAAIRMRALCTAIEERGSPEDASRFAKAFIDPEAVINSEVPVCGPDPGRVSELTNPLEFPFSSFFAATSAQKPPGDSHSYFITTSQAYVQFNFLQVERNGVRVDRRNGPEADWTLRDWEKAEICKAREKDSKPVIRRIRLTGGRRKIWIHRSPEDPKPTHRLQIRLSQGTSGRWIERIPDRSIVHQPAALDQEALALLRMSDLDFVEWGASNITGSWREAVDVRPKGCSFLDVD